MFENAIQACLDLTQYPATRDFGHEGSSAKEVVRVPHQNEVLDETTMSTLVAAIGFRNMLPHECGHVGSGTVYDTLQTDLGVYDMYC